MFMLLTMQDGSARDTEVYAYGYEDGVFWYQADKDRPLTSSEYLVEYEYTRIEFYPSREAALLDGADLRDYPPIA